MLAEWRLRAGVNGERILMYVFLLTVAGYGLFGVVAPSRLLQPKADWWLFDWLTGRVFYTSITRVRVTCGLMLAMAVALLSLALLVATR